MKDDFHTPKSPSFITGPQIWLIMRNHLLGSCFLQTHSWAQGPEHTIKHNTAPGSRRTTTHYNGWYQTGQGNCPQNTGPTVPNRRSSEGGTWQEVAPTACPSSSASKSKCLKSCLKVCWHLFFSDDWVPHTQGICAYSFPLTLSQCYIFLLLSHDTLVYLDH